MGKDFFSLVSEADRIRNLRRKMNWSQRQMASEFGVSPGAVAHWESGERKISGPVKKLLEIFESSSRKKV